MKFVWLLSLCAAVCICSGVELEIGDFAEPAEASPSEIQTRIVRGQRAQLGAFPWHALLNIQYRNNNQIIFCGGAILNRNWVLTSADCVVNATSIRIDAGSVDFYRPAVSVSGDSYFIPRDYNPRNFASNLGLVRIPLQSSLSFPNSPDANLAPIRLPALSQERETFQNQEVYFTGYGYTAYGRQNMSDSLLFTKQLVISNQQCLSYYNNNAQLIRPTVLCSASVDIREAVCGGDGGGPLVINEYGTWTLVGILSFLHGDGSCARRPVPAVYTRLNVRAYTDWIRLTANYQFRP